MSQQNARAHTLKGKPMNTYWKQATLALGALLFFAVMLIAEKADGWRRHIINGEPR
mgnify:CR=1 FL=1